jgi:hypothetical protein
MPMTLVAALIQPLTAAWTTGVRLNRRVFEEFLIVLYRRNKEKVGPAARQS